MDSVSTKKMDKAVAKAKAIARINDLADLAQRLADRKTNSSSTARQVLQDVSVRIRKGIR